jgi:subtilisin family serine protease
MKTRTLHWILAASLVGGSLLAGCQDGVTEDATPTATPQADLAPLHLVDGQDAIPGQYIVVFKDTVSKASIQAAIGNVSANKANKMVQQYKVFPGFAAQLDAKSLDQLRLDPNVAYIQQDQMMHLAANSNGQDRVDQDDGRDGAAYNSHGNDGSGVTVYVVDTGVNSGHNEFTGRYAHGRDTVDSDNVAEDCHGHGTHVASTAAGTQYGLATGANVVGVRVLNCQGSGSNSGVIGGVDWVTQNASGPSVANMSLGGGANSALDDAVNNAVAAGIFFAVAAGNDNGDACTKSPARATNAYTVGATEDSSDARASFSNFGACLDGYAPGRNITGAWINGSNATNTISGTSMASPHVAGAAALYLGSHPGSTPAQIEAGLDANNGINCVTDSKSSEDSMLHVDFNRGNFDCGRDGGGGDPPGGSGCVATGSCGGVSPEGCACDIWCVFFGDCCADGPC